MRLPQQCPNPTCAHALPDGERARFFRFKGAFERRDQRRVRRFQCKACGRHFSEQTGRHDFGQKRPEINAPLARLRASGLGIRAAARVLGLNRKTVSRRFAWADAQR